MLKFVVVAILLLFNLNSAGVCQSKTKAGSTAKKPSFQIEYLSIISENNPVIKIKSYLFRGIRYISVQNLGSIYGGWVNWYPVSGRVIFNTTGKKITFSVDNREVKINSTRYRMTKPATYINGEVCIPLEFLLSSAWTSAVKGETVWEPGSITLSFNTQYNLSLPRIYTTIKHTRIIFELEPDFKYEIISSSGNELGIAVFEGKSERGSTVVNVNDGRIEKIDVNQQPDRVIYKIFSMSEQLKPEIKEMADPKRLFVTYLSSIEETILKKLSEDSLNGACTYMVLLDSIPVSSDGKRRVKKIVVDPGHGGDDAGAKGKAKTKEKDLNLMLAKELARVLEEEYEYQVILTRTDDTFIPLYDRAQMANKEKANLFVSVHCNGSPGSAANGFEVYFLSETATDAQAEAVAAAENAVIALENGNMGKKREVDNILLNLEINAYMNQSSELAALIAQQVCRRVDIINNGVKQANFWVLRGTRMPAVLLETGYLTNSREEKKLCKRSFQTKIVDAWVKGIIEYEQRLNKE